MKPMDSSARINKYSILLVYLVSISPYLIYGFFYPYSPKHDWSYFNSLALMMKTYLMKGQVPLLDPWVCGGVDIMANPQNWIFSPFVILNFLFSPYASNFISILLSAAFGIYGMLKLTEKLEDKASGLLLAVIFNLSPFFFLHFIEGHIPYRTFYLLPLVLYLATTLDSFKKVLSLTAILAFMFLDGGIYPFYFSFFILLFNLNYSYLKKLLSKKEDLKSLIIIEVAFVSLLMAKALPVLSVHGKRVPENEYGTYTFSNFINSLFNIKQTNFSNFPGLPYFGHEYGMYLSFSIVVLLVIGLYKFKKHKWITFQLAFFSWLAFGIGGDINPWTVIKKIPLLNHIHVQSRFLIIIFLLILWLIARMDLNKKIKHILLSCAILELLFCAAYINVSGFKVEFNTQKLVVNPIKENTTLYKQYIFKPYVYSQGDLSFLCYEPAHNEITRTKKLFLGTNTDDLKASFNFNNVTINSSTPMNEKFIMNYAWNGGWSCENCNAYENNGMIEIDPKKNTKQVLLTYDPYHFQFSFFLFFLGLFLMFIGYRRTRGYKDEL